MNIPEMTMRATLPEQQIASTSTTCTECPANTLCHNDSLPGLVARIMAARCSAIVRAMRVEALLKARAV